MSPPSLTELQAFVSIAQAGSFAQAARLLAVSASALSHSLRGLESKLEIRLLNRTTRSVSLTEAGQHLLDRLLPAFNQIDVALEDLNHWRASPIGKLRLNAPQVAAEWILMPLVKQYLAQYPGMSVEIKADDHIVDIVKTGFDAGIRYGEVLQQDMVAIPIGQTPQFAVVASPDFIHRYGRPKNPQDLLQLPCIQTRFPSGHFYHWEFFQQGKSIKVAVQGAFIAWEMSLLIQAAKAGLGLAYVYRHLVEHAIQQGALISVLDDWCEPNDRFYLYYPSRQHQPAALRAFIHLITTDNLTSSTSSTITR